MFRRDPAPGPALLGIPEMQNGVGQQRHVFLGQLDIAPEFGAVAPGQVAGRQGRQGSRTVPIHHPGVEDRDFVVREIRPGRRFDDDLAVRKAHVALGHSDLCIPIVANPFGADRVPFLDDLHVAPETGEPVSLIESVAGPQPEVFLAQDGAQPFRHGSPVNDPHAQGVKGHLYLLDLFRSFLLGGHRLGREQEERYEEALIHPRSGPCPIRGPC